MAEGGRKGQQQELKATGGVQAVHGKAVKGGVKGGVIMDCINLQQRYGAIYRVFCEDSWEKEVENQRESRPWSMELRGRYGIVYPKGPNTFIAYTDGILTRGKLKAIGLRVIQWAESEATFEFGPDSMGQVAEVLKLRKKKRLSPEQKEIMSKRLSDHRFKTRFGHDRVQRNGVVLGEKP